MQSIFKLIIIHIRIVLDDDNENTQLRSTIGNY